MRDAGPRTARGAAKKLIEHAEWHFGEAGEVAGAVAKSEAALRRVCEARGVPYIPKFDLRSAMPPPLLPENADAWELFSACHTQLIVGGLGTILGVSHETLPWRMDLLEIPPDERYETDYKFRLIEAVFVRSCSERSGSQSQSNRGR